MERRFKLAVVTFVSFILIVIVLFVLGIGAHRALSCDYFNATEGKEPYYVDYLNAFYVAAGSLFTGLAFFITLYGLFQQNNEVQKQNKRLSEQISLDVFTEAFTHVMESDHFREARKYILSNQFDTDVDTLVSMTSTIIREELANLKTKYEKIKQGNESQSQYNNEIIHQKGDEEKYLQEVAKIRKKKEYQRALSKISIEDFRQIRSPLLNLTEMDSKNSEEVRKTSVVYERVKFFCDRMEYLGLIHYTYNNMGKNKKNTMLKDKYLIPDYLGYDIITSYKKLAPIIQSKKRKNKGNYYFNYTYLYYVTLDREKDYLENMNSEITELIRKHSRQSKETS